MKLALSRAGLVPAMLELEITETMMASDVDRAIEILGQLTAMGVKVSLDDFGTGYSSLRYLHLFPIDILKIDHAFVANIFNDLRSREIANAIVILSKNLNIDIVAEGIETKELEKVLIDLGCRYGQGYLYSRPIAFDQAMMLVKDQAEK